MISSGVILTKLLGNIRIYSGNPYQRSSIQGWNHFIITPHISWLCFFIFILSIYTYIYNINLRLFVEVRYSLLKAAAFQGL